MASSGTAPEPSIPQRPVVLNIVPTIIEFKISYFFLLKIVHFLRFNIWCIFYVLLRLKDGFVTFYCCILFKIYI